MGISNFSIAIFISLYSIAAVSQQQCRANNFGFRQLACETEYLAHECASLKDSLPAADRHLVRDCKIKSHVEGDANNLQTLADCATAFGDSLVDLVSSPFVLMTMIGTPLKATAQQKMQLSLIENCKDTKCKKAMLGDYASLFTKEEIEGHPTPGVDCKDAANVLICQGLSLATMVREVPSRLEKLRQSSSTSLGDFIAPWGKTESVHLSDFTTKLLNDIFQKAYCYSPEAQNQMACYAMFMVIDPIAAAGLVSKIKKVGKFRLKATTIGEKVSDLCDFCSFTHLKESTARHISARHLADKLERRRRLWTDIKSGIAYKELRSELREHVNILTKNAPQTTIFPPYVDIDKLQSAVRQMPKSKVKPVGEISGSGTQLHRGSIEIDGNKFEVEMWVCKTQPKCTDPKGVESDFNEIKTLYPVCGDGVLAIRKMKKDIELSLASCSF